jgi:lipoprotein-anchoring transpeptidase ErfK/SrfK
MDRWWSRRQRNVRHGFAWRLVVIMLAFASAQAMPPVASAEERWVQNHQPAELWSSSGPEAESFGPVRQFSYFRLHSDQVGGRFYVYSPKSDNFAWIDAKFVGPASKPPASYLAGPKVLETLDLPARAVGTASIWREPAQDDIIWARDVTHNTVLEVNAAVEGEDGETWYRLADGTYVPADQVRTPPPVEQRPGRWIHVSLSAPTIVTAYENGHAIYSALAIRGTSGWETPIGTYVLQRRVANERMRGPGYDVSNVLYTQYFTGVGHSIHYNYWSSNFGYAGSHGCLGMNYDDSFWFWNWATVGTPIVINW